MAKQKATKLQDFFNGNRRPASLVSWAHLKTKAGESRVKLDLKMPLLNHPVIGMPDAITEAFSVMAKDDSKIDRSTLNIICEGMTLEFFTADTGKHPAVSVTGSQLTKLALVATGEAEKRQLDLNLVAYIPAGVQLRDWAWDHLHASFFLEAVYSQSELEFSSEPVEDDDEEDEEEEE